MVFDGEPPTGTLSPEEKNTFLNKQQVIF